ncbi:MAG: Uma2 family endonuclease [Planctomycetia bacterium]|nr:Uma2 family endonuclease [Planctomycetia bacterium]
MATATRPITIGPADHGRAMSFDDFIEADFQDGWLYELARGVIDVTEVPGVNHGRIVGRVTGLFVLYMEARPGVINYRAGGGECRIRLPGMQSDRHPDQAIYLLPPPPGPKPWTRWVPQTVVEVVSQSGKKRDYVEKREEYLRAGVSEYWLLDPKHRKFLVLSRTGDVWEEVVIPAGGVHRTHFLPGLEFRPEELFGPAEGI